MPLKTVTGERAVPHKGRGATLNPEGRFESVDREAFDDGWSVPLPEDPTRPRTSVTPLTARSIIQHNDSPDVPFSSSVNPYQGCEHGCIYCLSGDTPILMGDGRTRRLSEVRTGDVLYGTTRSGWYRKYVRSRVLAHWRTIKPAYRVTLEDGTSLTAGADHRFLTERGWKFVTPLQDCGAKHRPFLTTNNKLMGTGAFTQPVTQNAEFKLGYLCGIVRGDGLLDSFRSQRAGREEGDQHQFRRALRDQEALDRTEAYLSDCEIGTHATVFKAAAQGRREMRAIRTHSRPNVERIRELIRWPDTASREWSAGFLSGLFDAEGSYSQGILRIGNADAEIIAWTTHSLRGLGFGYRLALVTRGRTKPITVVRITGGLREHLRFFQMVDPAITRKRDFCGQAVKSAAPLKVRSIEPIGKAMVLFDITTETGDFIANGVVSHNCYARPSHAYLELSPGLDFETRLFAKVNAAPLLREELAKPGYRCDPITIGANTDPYQPIERDWTITRQVLEVLAEHDHPCSIVTKNALVLRDLDLLEPMAAKNLVRVFVSVTTLDHEIARKMEPRASAPQRRIEAIHTLSAAGVPTGVMVAPIVPFLTDAGIEKALEAAAAAGARYAAYTLLRLPWELRELFKDWLAHNYPLKAEHVMSRVREMRGGRENDPNFGSRHRGTGLLAKLLAQRFEIACKRLGLNQDERAPLETGLFRPPSAGGQMNLF